MITMMLKATGRCLAALCLVASAASQASDCPPAQASAKQLRLLAAQGWGVADDAVRESLAIALLPCLASSDPELRDDLAFTALATWMRAKALSAGTLRQVGQRALGMMQGADQQGFAQPFAALTLAEVARADRLQPLWTDGERHAVMLAANRYMRETRDYRGFDESTGWRHAVAHAADLLMQLSLNPMLNREQLDLLLDAVLAQVLPLGHFYIYGEGQRLARPVLFTARRQLHSTEEWTAWLGRIADQAAVAAKQPAGQEPLAHVHNAKAFFLALYVAVQESGDAELRARLAPAVVAALRRMQ